MRLLFATALPLLLAAAADAQTALPPVTAPFTIHRVAQGIGQGYSLVVTDMNHDGKPDLVALGLTANAITWYENPSWTPHTGLPRRTRSSRPNSLSFTGRTPGVRRSSPRCRGSASTQEAPASS